MFKKIIITSLCCAFAISNAQKVGINTTSAPTQTLDVEGNMRINAPTTTKTKQSLAWNPKNQQVVKLDDEKVDKKFYYLNYRINVSKAGDDWANDINLGIDSDKYYATLIQANLVNSDFTYDDPNAGAVYIPAVIADKNDPRSVNIATFRDERLADNNGIIDRAGKSVGFPIKDTRLKIQNGSYHFYGDYENVSPTSIGRSNKYSWRIAVFVVKK